MEGVSKGLEQLFTEANVEYDVSEVEGSDTWKLQTEDKRLTVYLRDFIGISRELTGQFDAVFDRGALEAIRESDRPGYISTVRDLLKEDFVYILCCYDYKPEDYRTTTPVPPQMVEELFEEFATVELLARQREEERAIKWNIPSLTRNTFLIKRK